MIPNNQNLMGQKSSASWTLTCETGNSCAGQDGPQCWDHSPHWTTATACSHKQLPIYAFTGFFKLAQYLLLLLYHHRPDGIAPQTVLHLYHFTVAMPWKPAFKSSPSSPMRRKHFFWQWISQIPFQRQPSLLEVTVRNNLSLIVLFR